MRKQLGFTLFELLATLGIGGLLLSIGVPSLTSFVRDANIIGGTNGLLADLYYARNLAVTTNRRIVTCASSDGASCSNSAPWTDGRITFRDDNNNLTLDAGEEVVRVGKALASLGVSSVQFPSKITYRPNGRVMGAAVATNIGAFIVCDTRGPTHARSIIVDFNGRPRAVRLSDIGVTAVCPAIV
ncbi:MAG TPA: GspH/FimT family pseudopilin [Vicinamibacterales bacterium]|nr:GspH/FimT family pseudopilin [Vicinamibacterales bacterium]